MFKVFDFECECGVRKDDVMVGDGEAVPCECGKTMFKLFPTARSKDFRGKFSPFWSDTMQCRINDREDLNKLKQYAKDNGLTCVGHNAQKPDRAAIRYNYEHD